MTERIRVALAKNGYCYRSYYTSDDYLGVNCMTSFEFYGNCHKTWTVKFSRRFVSFEETLKIVYVAGFGI